jgi:hypothetical protein
MPNMRTTFQPASAVSSEKGQWSRDNGCDLTGSLNFIYMGQALTLLFCVQMRLLLITRGEVHASKGSG